MLLRARPLVADCCDAGEDFALDGFEHCAAAGGNVAHLVGIAHLGIKDLKCETHKEWDKKAFEILEKHGYRITDTIPADIKERLDIACGISRGT